MTTIYSPECQKSRLYTRSDTTASVSPIAFCILRMNMKAAVSSVIGPVRAEELFPARTVKFRRYESLSARSWE